MKEHSFQLLFLHLIFDIYQYSDAEVPVRMLERRHTHLQIESGSGTSNFSAQIALLDFRTTRKAGHYGLGGATMTAKPGGAALCPALYGVNAPCSLSQSFA